jgi:mono/diheme cytochrome c family protein
VQPLIETHCAVCHGPGQQIPRLDSYDAIALTTTKQKVFFQVQHCYMPPATRPALTPAERDTILSWLVCGAINN